MAKNPDNEFWKFTCCPVHIFTAIQWLPTWYIQMHTVQWGCWLLAPLEWVTLQAWNWDESSQGCEVSRTNRSYPAEWEPARSSPIDRIARLSGSERLRRSTAKISLALLCIYIYIYIYMYIYTYNCVFGFLISDVTCKYLSADVGRDGLWWPALPGHRLSYTGCWQSLLVMYLTGMLFLFQPPPEDVLVHGFRFSNNGLNMLPWTSFTCYTKDNQQGCFRLSNWFSLRRLGPWTNHLPASCMIVHFSAYISKMRLGM